MQSMISISSHCSFPQLRGRVRLGGSGRRKVLDKWIAEQFLWELHSSHLNTMDLEVGNLSLHFPVIHASYNCSMYLIERGFPVIILCLLNIHFFKADHRIHS